MASRYTKSHLQSSLTVKHVSMSYFKNAYRLAHEDHPQNHVRRFVILPLIAQTGI